MASLIPNILLKDPHTQIYVAGASIVLLVGIIFATFLSSTKKNDAEPSLLVALARFVYGCFLKPHESDGNGSQQDALESFYKTQAGIYDTTRRALLRGREDMLGLVAAQLVQKAAKDRSHDSKRVWVDVSCIIQHYVQLVSNNDKGWRRYWIQYRSHVCLRICSRLLLFSLPCGFLTFPLRSRPKTLCEIGLGKCKGGVSRC